MKQESPVFRHGECQFVDTGLRNARLDFAYPDEGKMVENIVYNELIRKGYTVNVGMFDMIEKNADGKSVRKSFEVDFRAVKGNRSMYIQVCNDIEDNKIKAYQKIYDEVQKVIVVNRPIAETKESHGYTVIGVTDFLLKFI